jgi:MFS family permease
MMTANNMAIIAAIFSSKRRGQGMGLMNTTVGLGAITGPMVGGALVTSFGWRSVFFFGVALSVVAIVAVLLIIDEKRIGVQYGGRRPTFDNVGAAVSAVALLLLLLALTNGQRMGWVSPIVLVGISGFVVLLAFFIGWELKVRSPMLDIRLFARRVFSLGVTARALGMLGSSSVFFLMPFYLQGVLGYTAGKAGLIIVSGSSGMAIAAFFSGRLSDRFGWRPFITGGLALVASGLFLMSRLNQSMPIGVVMAGLAMQGLGMGTFISPNLSAILGAVEEQKHGVTTALVNLIRTGTNLIGIALATAIVSSVMIQAGYEPRLDVAVRSSPGVASAFTEGMQLALLVMSGCVALGCVATLFMVERNARDRTNGASSEISPGG